LVKIRSLESTFGVKGGDLEPKGKRSVANLKTAIDTDLVSLEREVDEVLSRMSRAEGMLRDIEQQVKELTPFARASLPLELYHGYETLVVFTGIIPQDVTLPMSHEKVYAPSKEGNFLAVFTQRGNQESVAKVLESHHFVPVPVPKGEGMPQKLLENLIQKMDELRQEIALMETHLAKLREDQLEFVVACEELLTVEVEQAEAPLRFAVTEQSFIAEGWVPDEEVDRLKSGIALATGGKTLVRDLPKDKHQLPPVEYDNPKVF
jgi:Archaeal/vacuolar-type H+-ATPase subunit I